MDILLYIGVGLMLTVVSSLTGVANTKGELHSFFFAVSVSSGGMLIILTFLLLFLFVLGL